jgi:hypothetical protein
MADSYIGRVEKRIFFLMRPAGNYEYLGAMLTSGSKLDSLVTPDHGRDADEGRYGKRRIPERVHKISFQLPLLMLKYLASTEATYVCIR